MSVIAILRQLSIEQQCGPRCHQSYLLHPAPPGLLLRSMCVDKSFFVSLLCLLTCLAASSSEPVHVRESESPQATVTKYCDLDFSGARLAGESYAKVEHLTRWSHPAEPAWDAATVVSGFNVISSKQSGKHAVITVRYTILGELEGPSVQGNEQKGNREIRGGTRAAGMVVETGYRPCTG